VSRIARTAERFASDPLKPIRHVYNSAKKEIVGDVTGTVRFATNTVAASKSARSTTPQGRSKQLRTEQQTPWPRPSLA
jgi:hypothetical protein